MMLCVRLQGISRVETSQRTIEHLFFTYKAKHKLGEIYG